MKNLNNISFKSISKIFTFVYFALIISACSKTDDKKPADIEIYKNSELGWEMKIIPGWNKMGEEKLKQMTNKGKSKIEESMQIEIDNIDATKYLLCVEKGLNQFVTNITKQSKEEYDESVSAMKDILLQTYTSSGIEVNVIENPDINIDGVNFKHTTYKLSSQGNSFEQNFYTTYHKGYLFVATLTTYQDDIKKEIEDAFKNSKFQK